MTSSKGKTYVRPQNIFFAGKGGVGKSTCCVALSAYLTRQNVAHRVISLDRAHSIQTLMSSIKERQGLSIREGLSLGAKGSGAKGSGAKGSGAKGSEEMEANVYEPDFDALSQKWLAGLARKIRKNYRYLAPLNLDGFSEVVRLTPGVQEHLMIRELERLVFEQKTSDELVLVDLPATASFHNLINYLVSGEKWTQALGALQKRISRGERWVEKVSGPQKESQNHQGMTQALRKSEERFGRVREGMASPQTAFVAVVNPEALSHEEIVTGVSVLKRIGAEFGVLVTNRKEGESISQNHDSTQSSDHFSEFSSLLSSEASRLSWPVDQGLRQGDVEAYVALGRALWQALTE